jgi:hypothetical protein
MSDERRRLATSDSIARQTVRASPGPNGRGTCCCTHGGSDDVSNLVPQAIDNVDLLSKRFKSRHARNQTNEFEANRGSSSLALVSSTLPAGTSTCTRCSTQSGLRERHDDNLSTKTSTSHIKSRSIVRASVESEATSSKNDVRIYTNALSENNKISVENDIYSVKSNTYPVESGYTYPVESGYTYPVENGYNSIMQRDDVITYDPLIPT